MASEIKKFNNLEGLRGIAALVVAAGHMLWIPTQPLLMKTYGNPNVDYPPAQNAFWLNIINFTAPSEAWVMIFFLISGFVVERSLQENTAKEFIIRRVIRIYIPSTAAYLIFLFCLSFRGALNEDIELWRFILDITLINGGLPWGIGGPWILGVLWTLWFEIRYYLSVATLKYFRLTFQHRFLTLCILSIAMSALDTFGLLAMPPQIQTAAYANVFIGFGSLVYRFHVRQSQLTLLFAFVVATLFASIFGEVEFFFTRNLTPFWMSISIFIVSVNAPEAKGRLSKLLGILGKYSYSLYLTHSIFGVIVYVQLLEYYSPVPSLIFSLFALIIGVKIFYELFESHSLKIINRRKLKN